ncbi:MAG TPA: energy transducer TonB [Rhodanobacteraceae bacterium]|nr:energy transducer TonB [Rhodanobacteraceae bacterium]
MKPGAANGKSGIGGALIAAIALALAFSMEASAASNLRAVPPEQLDHYWWMTNTQIDADVPNFGRNLEKPTCAAVTYEIGADGVTRDIVVRRVVPAGDLGQVAKSAVADLHYAPAPDNSAREPVFTYIIMPFNLPPDPATRAKITAACKLADFPAAYQ